MLAFITGKEWPPSKPGVSRKPSPTSNGHWRKIPGTRGRTAIWDWLTNVWGIWQGLEYHYLKALEIRDDFVQAHFNLARLTLIEGDTARALASLRRAIEIAPDHTDALNLLGMELGKAGNFEEARTHLERAVSVDPDFSEAHNNLGTVFAASGELEKALEQFKEAVRADPANRGAVSRITQVERMLRERQ